MISKFLALATVWVEGHFFEMENCRRSTFRTLEEGQESLPDKVSFRSYPQFRCPQELCQQSGGHPNLQHTHKKKMTEMKI